MDGKELLIQKFMNEIKPENLDRILNDLKKIDSTSHEQVVSKKPLSPPHPFPS